MYAATENHSILTIFKWERRHARSFLTMPRTADQKTRGMAIVRGYRPWRLLFASNVAILSVVLMARACRASSTSPQIFSRLDID